MRKSNKIVKPRPHYHVLYDAGIEQRKLRAHLKAIICIGNAIIQKKNQHFLGLFIPDYESLWGFL